MQAPTRATAILIVGALLGVAPTGSASDGGWLLWVKTLYFRQDGAEPGDGFKDRWSVEDGYDTAADCHAAARVKGDGIDKTTNSYTAKREPVGFVSVNKCFPVGFDPRVIK